MTQNKALWIFPNIKESVDMLPQKLRGQAWEMIINYSFGDENVEQNCKNLKVLLAFRVVKPLLRLRGIAGSQNGKSNNPSGLAKNNEPNIAPNIGANIPPNLLNNRNRNNLTETKTETKTENKKQKLKTEDIIDFESLFIYWEQNKKGGKYKPESRQRMFKKLKDLTNNDFEYAKKAIFYAIDNNYQGFTDGSRLYYKEKPTQKSLYEKCVENGLKFLEDTND